MLRPPLVLINGATATMPSGDGVPPANGGVDLTAWAAYTPTISAASGSFTSVSTRGRYKQIGKTVFFRATVIITTNGSAAGYVIVGLPLPVVTTAASDGWSFPAYENQQTGMPLTAYAGSGAATFNIIKSSNQTYPGGDGYGLQINGSYETP